MGLGLKVHGAGFPKFCSLVQGLQNPKGPKTQIIGFQGPNTIDGIVFGPLNPVIRVLGPLGEGLQSPAAAFSRTPVAMILISRVVAPKAARNSADFEATWFRACPKA